MEAQNHKDEKVKESFQNVKRDIDILNFDLSVLKQNISDLKQDIAKICDILEKISSELQKTRLETAKKQEIIPILTPTNRQINQTTPTHFPTHAWPLNPLKSQKQAFSIGNEGVPTDRQTNQQTDNWSEIGIKTPIQQSIFIQNNLKQSKITSPIEDAAKILDSLDSLKKEIRLKFKNLTEQELLVFSTLYQLEEDQGPVEYKILAQKLGLTESSIRDYIGRLLKKGIPVDKTKLNNKQVKLSISQSLKKVTSLSTILQLRGI